jgi:hypothetical protein
MSSRCSGTFEVNVSHVAAASRTIVGVANNVGSRCIASSVRPASATCADSQSVYAADGVNCRSPKELLRVIAVRAGQRSCLEQRRWGNGIRRWCDIRGFPATDVQVDGAAALVKEKLVLIRAINDESQGTRMLRG